MAEDVFLAGGDGKNHSKMVCPWGAECDWQYRPWACGQRQIFDGPNASCLIRRDLCTHRTQGHN